MRTIKWHADLGTAASRIKGEFNVEEDVNDATVDKLVRDTVLEELSLGWKAQPYRQGKI